MILKENNSGSDFEPIEEGLYDAICVTVAGIGRQETPWGDKEKLILTWELPTVRREWEKDGEKHEGPAHLSNTYTASISPNAKLRSILESWRGKPFSPEELQGFDLVNILGAPCQVLIKHNTAKDGRVFANVVDVLKSSGGKHEPESELVHYDPMNHDPEAEAKLPEWISSKIVHATNDPIDTGAPQREDIEELDEIPF